MMHWRPWIESVARDAAVVLVKLAGRARPVHRTPAHGIEELERRVMLSAAFAFGPQATFAVGSGPEGVAVVDLNRDGKLDLVAANSAGNSISVLLGNGDGTFAAQQTYGAGGSPGGLAVADVNRDGKPDVVVVNSTLNVVDVMPGNGDGTLAAPVTFATGSQPDAVVVADFNGDGKPDVAVANYGGNNVGILAGNGNGTFALQQTVATNIGPTALASGDLNRDGKVDLVAGNNGSHNLTVMLGAGNGTFATSTATNDFAGRTVVIADARNTGIPDVIYTSNSIGFGSTTEIIDRQGNGDGTLGVGFGTMGGRSFLPADLNVDGRLDIVKTSLTDNTVGIPFSLTQQSSFATGNTPYDLAVGDLNGDGRPDLVVTNRGDGTVSVLPGDVPPTLLSIQLTTPNDPFTSDSNVGFIVTFSKPVIGVEVSDFQPTIEGGATASSMAVQQLTPSVFQVTVGGVAGLGGIVGLSLFDNGHIKHLAGNPLQPGRLTPIGASMALNGGGAPANVEVGDVNNDGIPDAVVNEPYASFGVVLLGKGDGTFLANPHTFGTGATASTAASLTLADVNSDGKLDVIVTQSSQNTVAVLPGAGDGSFGTPETFTTGANPASVTTADVNGDGHVDVIVGNASGSSISILLGNGDGTFLASQTFATGTFPHDLNVIDLNGDGKLDIAYVQYGSVGIVLGKGDGTFRPQFTFGSEANANAIDVADLNRDGKPDLVALSNRITVYFGNGDGTFAAGKTFAASDGRAIAVADINGDGLADVVLPYRGTTPLGAGLGVLLGNGDGTFGAMRTFGGAPGTIPTQFITVGDMNRDGRPDVITNNNVFFGATSASYAGPSYSVVPYLNMINGTGSPNDNISVSEEPDHAHVLWTHPTASEGSPTQGRMAIDDPDGLTINGVAGSTITVAINQNSLPNRVHINGTVYLYSPTATQFPFSIARTTLDVGTGTLFIGYYSAAFDPIATIRAALMAGYNGGAWNGTTNGTTGAITSSAAALDPAHYALGYADSGDGSGVNTTPNTIEIKYTLAGDANLDGKVLLGDFNTLQTNFGTVSGAAWDQGDFNYDGKVLLGDFNTVQSNFGSALPAASAAVGQSGSASASSAATVYAWVQGPVSGGATAEVGTSDDLVTGKDHPRKRRLRW